MVLALCKASLHHEALDLLEGTSVPIKDVTFECALKTQVLFRESVRGSVYEKVRALVRVRELVCVCACVQANKCVRERAEKLFIPLVSQATPTIFHSNFT